MTEPAGTTWIAEIIGTLERSYGAPAPPLTTDPLELILWESVGYLVDDRRRETAFRALQERVGTRPAAILDATDETLEGICRLGGMVPELRAQRMRQIAQIALEAFDGDLRPALKRAPAQAKKALLRFPGIGEPGAEKILLFTGSHPALALESNGLRVLVRLGAAEEQSSYGATYRAVRQALEGQLSSDCDWLMRAHELLRKHGQETCRRSAPHCDACLLTAQCAYYRSHV